MVDLQHGRPATGETMQAIIKSVAFHVPDRILTNHELAEKFPEWPAERIERKLGIRTRRIANENETASDLGIEAVKKLLLEAGYKSDSIDYLLFCTQSADYFLPSSACVMQHRLGLRTSIGAVDLNQGCSGYVYGLGLAKGLIESQQVSNVLLVTSDTYSKYLHHDDKSVRTIFGDGATATLLTGVNREAQGVGPFVMGTDGGGATNLIVAAGAARSPANCYSTNKTKGAWDNRERFLVMNGGEIANFTLEVVPKALNKLIKKAGITMADVDLFIFHQANAYMLDALRKKCEIPEEKFMLCVRDFGNTVSSSIPISLVHAVRDGRLLSDNVVMLVGFGVGYSWGACLVRWQ